MKKVLIAVVVVLVVLVIAFFVLRDPYRASDAIQAQVSDSQEPTEAAGEEESPAGERVAFETAELMFTGSSALGEQPGFFEKVSGELVLAEDGSPRAIKGTVDMATVLTNADSLTAKLKNEPGMFEVGKYPTASFVSTAIGPASGEAAEKGATHEVQGNLTLRGVTKSFTFPARIEVTPQQVSLSSEFSVDRQWFGINYDGGTAFPEIRDLVLINLDIEAARTPPSTDTRSTPTPSDQDEPTTRPAS